LKEEIVKLVGDKLDGLEVFIDDVVYEKEGRTNYLRVILDSKDMIDIDKVVEATKIIDPILDENDLIKDKYILDVYAKSKGDE